MTDLAEIREWVKFPPDNATFVEATDRIKRLLTLCEAQQAALKEISEGKGKFDTDPLTHAANTIEDMTAIALGALK